MLKGRGASLLVLARRRTMAAISPLQRTILETLADFVLLDELAIELIRNDSRTGHSDNFDMVGRALGIIEMMMAVMMIGR